MLEYFTIEGGVPLRGEITPSGNKNAALPALAATLMTDEPVILRNLPAIRDVQTMGKLLQTLGVEVKMHDPHTWELCAAGVAVPRAPQEVQQFVQAIRGSILITGPLLARLGEAAIPAPGGDVIGRRRVDTHFLAFEALELPADAGQRINVYTAEPGSPSQEALDILASWASTPSEPSASP